MAIKVGEGEFLVDVKAAKHKLRADSIKQWRNRVRLVWRYLLRTPAVHLAALGLAGSWVYGATTLGRYVGGGPGSLLGAIASIVIPIILFTWWVEAGRDAVTNIKRHW